MKNVLLIIIALLLTIIVCQENEQTDYSDDWNSKCRKKCEGSNRCYLECMRRKGDDDEDKCMKKCMKEGKPFTHCYRKCHH